MSNSNRHGQAAKAKTNTYATWQGPKPGTHSHAAAQSRRWKCQGVGGCGYSWNTFDQGICQSCNLHWQFDKRAKTHGGKGGAQGAGQDNVPVKPPWVDDPKPKKPTTTRWGSWDWKWEPADAKGEPTTPGEAKQLEIDILAVSKEIEQLESLLGKEHGEVAIRQAKLDALRTKQKENEPVMPHEQKLRKNLWEVRDCEVKIKKLQASFEVAQAKTLAAKKEEDEVAEAIVAVTKQKEEALASQQTLLSLCKKMQSDKEVHNAQPKKWAEGMAGLSTLMSCCTEMGGTLSAEDQALFNTLLKIQGRLAALTTVVDEPDHEMDDSDSGAKSSRADGDSEAEAQAKRQKIIDEGGTQPPQENEPGTGSANVGASGAVTGLLPLP
jgi:hypothetical protein